MSPLQRTLAALPFAFALCLAACGPSNADQPSATDTQAPAPLPSQTAPAESRQTDTQSLEEFYAGASGDNSAGDMDNPAIDTSHDDDPELQDNGPSAPPRLAPVQRDPMPVGPPNPVPQ